MQLWLTVMHVRDGLFPLSTSKFVYIDFLESMADEFVVHREILAKNFIFSIAEIAFIIFTFGSPNGYRSPSRLIWISIKKTKKILCLFNQTYHNYTRFPMQTKRWKYIYLTKIYKIWTVTVVFSPAHRCTLSAMHYRRWPLPLYHMHNVLPHLPVLHQHAPPHYTAQMINSIFLQISWSINNYKY